MAGNRDNLHNFFLSPPAEMLSVFQQLRDIGIFTSGWENSFAVRKVRHFMDCFHDGFGSQALVEGKRLRLDLSLDDIEEAQGYVAAEANHTPDKKLQKRLDKLFEKLQTFLDRYDDQD